MKFPLRHNTPHFGSPVTWFYYIPWFHVPSRVRWDEIVPSRIGVIGRLSVCPCASNFSETHRKFRVSESLSSVLTNMDAEEFRKAGYQAVDQSNMTVLQRWFEVIEYFKTISDRPVIPSVHPGFMRKQLPTEIPTEGVKWDEIQPDIEKLIMVFLQRSISNNFSLE